MCLYKAGTPQKLKRDIGFLEFGLKYITIESTSHLYTDNIDIYLFSVFRRNLQASRQQKYIV